MKYVIYCRKSSEGEDRQALSLPAQERELKELASKRGLEVVKVFAESQSAKAPGRPLFNQMIDLIGDGKVEGIICWKLDRLSRNPLDAGTTQWLMERRLLKQVVTSERTHYAEDNVLLMNVELGMSQQYIRDLRKNVKRGNRERALRGYPNHLPPLGYINDKAEKTVVKDPERFDMIRKVWDLALTGNYSVPEIHRIVNDEWGFRTPGRGSWGGKELAQSTLYKMLTNQFYTGTFIQDGVEYQGKYPPMITVEEYDAVQIILGAKGRRRPQKHDFPFTGIITCGECGCRVTAEVKQKFYPKTGNFAEYPYYHCTRRKRHVHCSQKSVTFDELEKQIDAILEKITISDKFLKLAIKYLNKMNDQEIDDRTNIYQNLQKIHAQKQKELDALTKMRFRDLIDDEEFIKQKKELQTDISSLESKMHGAEDRAKEWFELAEKTFNFATYARYWFENGSKQDQRIILQSLGSNFILKDQKLTFCIQKPFQIISERSSDSSWWAR